MCLQMDRYTSSHKNLCMYRHIHVWWLSGECPGWTKVHHKPLGSMNKIQFGNIAAWHRVASLCLFSETGTWQSKSTIVLFNLDFEQPRSTKVAQSLRQTTQSNWLLWNTKRHIIFSSSYSPPPLVSSLKSLAFP